MKKYMGFEPDWVYEFGKICILVLCAFILFGMLAVMSNCNGVTSPSPTPTPEAAVVATATPAPTLVEPPAAEPAWSVKCEAGGSMTVKYSGEASHARLLTYYTSFDSPVQYAEQWDTVATGNTVVRTFPSCSQSDAEPESGRAAGHCYFDKSGNPTSAQAAVESCKSTQCTDEPKVEKRTSYGEWGACQKSEVNPSGENGGSCQKSRTNTVYVTTTYCDGKVVEDKYTETEKQACECPCIEEWKEQQPEITYGSYGECVEKNPKAPEITQSTQTPPPQYTQCPGLKARQVRTVIREINSCTRASRVKSDNTTTEETSCTFQCIAAVCHTENNQYCGNGWYKEQGDWKYGYHCDNQYFFGSTEKWQCQNVPPGVPGHYDNHFNKNGHEDFFGSCGPVGGTSDKCYSITN